MWRAGRGLSLRLIEGRSRPFFCPQTKPSSSSSSSSQRPQTEKQRRRRLKDEAILSAKDSVKPAEDSVVRWREKQKIEYTGATSPGAKKDCSLPFPSAYCPDYVESSWYQWWEKEGFFTPEQHERLPQALDRTFSLCIPPPNVTGMLHLGHALTVAVEDALVRWRRMQGHRVLWVPGCDHAGIATQTVVERKLLKERGLSRKDFSREEFLQEIWRWKNEKGEEIYEQLRKLGASLDWSRACFTLDPGFSRAVTEAFVRLYDSGLIYRSEALVNWSCALQSAISDIEVDSLELKGQTMLPVPGYDRKVEFGTMVTFAYPLDGHDGEVCVSTTRPETILGDVAVAVHPEDPRYQAVHGKLLRHPFSDRLLPVITDRSVNMTLGTGAAKVTPAHDQADFLLSQRHALPRLTVMAGDGTMTPPCGDWLQGVKRFDARQQVIEALTEKKLFRGKKSHAMTLPVCSRSGDIIEPLLKQQWFLRCESMAGKAVQAVENGELEIVPQLYTKTWKNWLSNISDWCISRQLWWGHQIPAYKVQLPDSAEAQKEELWVCGRSEDEARRRAAVKYGVKHEDITLTQDPDVLDTWFSSALFPFAMLGWPDQTPDLQRFYPNSMLETGSDLIFFWVARMVMLGTELTGQLPFKQVLLHAMVRDKHSRKMSKSLGNVIDPLDIIHGVSLERLEEKVYEGNLDPREQQVAIEAQRRDYPGGIPQCGTDALRFSLCFQKIQGDTINLSLSHVLSCRHFCNKMWQTLRFTLGVLESNNMTKIGALEETTPLSSMDRWICSRLYSTVRQVEAAFESYELQTVTSTLHTFWLTSLCDVYLECVKPLLTQQEGRGHSRDEAAARAAASVLYHCVSTSLTLLSPFMPFITEELWQRLQPFGGGASGQSSISLQPYPRSEQLAHWFFPDEERDFSLALEVIREARSLKVQTELTRTRPDMWVVCSPAQAHLLLHFESAVKTLCQVSSLHVYCPDVTDGPPSLSSTPPPAGTLVGVVDHTCQIHLHVQCGVNLDKQLKRLSERRQKLLLKLEDLMNRIQPEAKVPAHARQHIETKVSSLQTQLKTLEDQIGALQESQKG